MIKAWLNGKEIETEEGKTILQVLEDNGMSVPHFCYHRHLKAEGNCRLCLVDVEGRDRPVTSCTTPLLEGMKVATSSDRLEKARSDVIEFLLLNHPLDCPVCDKGGECRLQEHALSCGRGVQRIFEQRRQVSMKNVHPLVSTFMKRCIHCTRCIRFMKDVVGRPDLGMFGKGARAEVGSFLNRPTRSPLGGNIVDLCPVGALLSKPFTENSFRPWELLKTPGIDLTDSLGSSVFFESAGGKIRRVTPRENPSVNEVWISDKARFSYDSFSEKRLDRPYVRDREGLKEVSWEDALEVVALRMKAASAHPEKMGAVSGKLVDCEGVFSLKSLFDSLACNRYDCRQDRGVFLPNIRESRLFNMKLAGFERTDVLLLVHCNLEFEAPVSALHLRRTPTKIAVIGPEIDLSLPYEHLGNSPSILNDIEEGKHPFSRVLKQARYPSLILGQESLKRPDSFDILNQSLALSFECGLFKEGWNGFNVLPPDASRTGALDLGFHSVSDVIDGSEFLYVLGADELPVSGKPAEFIVYQGTHMTGFAEKHADVLLPSAMVHEKDGTYVNAEGTVQQSKKAIDPAGFSKEDWKIVRALSERIGKTLPFDTLSALRDRMMSTLEHPLENALLSLDFSACKTALSGPPFQETFDYWNDTVLMRYSPNIRRLQRGRKE